MQNWWKNLFLKKKLIVIVGSVGAVLVFQLTIIIVIVNLLTTIRILVAGESYWSKAHKDAVKELTSYVLTSDPNAYNNFLEELKVSLGDKVAREELGKKNGFNEALVSEGLLQGKSHPEDIRYVIPILRTIYSNDQFQQVLDIWKDGDLAISRLIALGEKIHLEINTNKKLSEDQMTNYVQEISRTSKIITEFELKFSNKLGDLSRMIEYLMKWTLTIILITVISVGFFIVASANRAFSKSLKAIMNVVSEVKNGNFDQRLDIKARDEIGILSEKLNGMFASLKEQIAGRKFAEEGQSQLKILADAMPQIVFITDPTGTMKFCNQRLWDYIGKPPCNPQNLRWTEYIHPEDLKLLTKRLASSAREGVLLEQEFRIRNHHGDYFWVLGRAIPEIGSNGSIVQWYGTATNIQVLKNIQNELESSVKVRDSFLSIASHELKTPLTTFKLQNQLRFRYFEKGQHERFSIEALGKILSEDKVQIDKLTKLVDDMLDISRIQNNSLRIEKSEFELSNFLENIIQSSDANAKEFGVSISLLGQEKILVNWDSIRIEQVLFNLISNAFKYGNGTDVKLEYKCSKNIVSLSISDRGLGIRPEDKEKIFCQYERGAVTYGISGLGLGLFIVKQIVEAHKGSIEVESQLGSGSTFILKLPQA